jgi:hypothetical protein
MVPVNREPRGGLDVAALCPSGRYCRGRMEEAPKNDKLPRGIIAIIAVGLLACVAAAVLSTDKGSGEAADLEWVKQATAPDSKAVPVPGGKQSMRLTDNEIRATGRNVSGYTLFRVSSTLRIGKGAPIGSGRIVCSVKTARGTEIAQTSGGLRATYPRSSDGLFTQEVPDVILVDFSSHGLELAVLEVEDLPNLFTTERGVKLEWPTYEVGTEHLQYFLPDGKPKQEFELPFDTVWKTTGVPAAKTSCELTTSAGKATVRSAAALQHVPPPIDEEAEEEKAEAEEERREAEEG